MRTSIAGAITTVVAAITAGLALAAAWTFFVSWIVMLCWNYLAPTFGLPFLGWWQSFVLMFLCSLLFKSSASVSKSE